MIKIVDKGFFEIAKIFTSKKKVPEFHSGYAGEHFIVKGWLEVDINTLEQMRVILNGVIKYKKEMKRVNEHNAVNTADIGNNCTKDL